MKFPISVLLAAACAVTASVASAQETLTFSRFGKLTLYGDTKDPAGVALLASGERGWNHIVEDMARAVAEEGVLVIGVDTGRYLKALEAAADKCAYPAADFEALSQFVQKKLELVRYQTPQLIGYSTGAALTYASAQQAPPGTFSSVVSLGFCPRISLVKPLCRGSGPRIAESDDGSQRFLPPEKFPVPWVVLQGEEDAVCDPRKAIEFVGGSDVGGVVVLSKVGHDFDYKQNWIPQLKAAATKLKPNPAASQTAEQVGDLPLVELPANAAANDTLAVIISGNGGWAGIDKSLGELFAQQGIAVVGLNSLQYFWKKRDPDVAARDLERIVRHYLTAWKKEKLLLVGYSTGADVLPFMTSRLPKELLSRVKLVALLGPSSNASFEFHVAEWIGLSPAKQAHPVRPEVAKLQGTRVLCIYGEEEKDSLCTKLAPDMATRKVLKGAHHFGGDYRALAAEILKSAE
jgi:type IV secretory pathway VirJ component